MLFVFQICAICGSFLRIFSEDVAAKGETETKMENNTETKTETETATEVIPCGFPSKQLLKRCDFLALT